MVRQKQSLTDTPGRAPSLHPQPGVRPFGGMGDGQLSIALLLLLEDKRKVTKQDALDEDVLNRGEFSKRVAALAASLGFILRQQERPAAKRLAGQLNRDWASMTAKQRGVALRAAAAELQQIPRGVEAKLSASAITAALVMDRRAREAGIRANNLNVAVAPTTAEENKAMRFARPTADFVNADYQRRGVAFAGSAAVAIGIGMRLGESSSQITARVQQRAEVALGRDFYLQGVAGSILNRARNSSLLNIFREAGTGFVQVLSTRDERTCEKCLFMHGTIFPVGPAFDHMDRVSQLRTPSQIAEFNPFLREGVNANGDRVIYVPGGDGARLTLGTVLESRQGQVDRLSTFDRKPNPVELLSLGIGLPSYHPDCRCVTVIA